MLSTKRTRMMPVVLLVNAGRIDFDRALDFSPLDAICTIVRHDTDAAAAEIAARASSCEAEILVTKEIPITAEAIEALPASVKMICEAGTGFNNVCLTAAQKRGILVTNVAGYSSASVAHLVISQVLSFACSLHLQYAALRAGDRDSFTGSVPCGEPRGMPHFELGGKIIGLVGGTGAIAAEVRKVALALGMRVLVYSRSGNAPDGAEAVDLHMLLATSDFVSLHCPLKPETKGLIDGAALKAMKRTAYLINTARGAIIDQDALIEAMQHNPPRIAGAALDVQEVEPPPADSPLYGLRNVVLTPHIGWKRAETRQRLVELVAENVRRFLDGDPCNVVGCS